MERGAYNIVLSPLEVSRSIEQGIEEGSLYKPFFISPFEGLAKMIGRIFVGIYEVATFPIPQDPILKPVYISPTIGEYLKEKNESDHP